MKIIPLLFSLFLLALLIYFSDVAKILDILTRVDLIFVGLGLAVWFLGAVIRTFRWRYLLRHVNVNVSFLKCLKVLVSGIFIANLTPGKTGEPVRSLLLKNETGDSLSVTLPSIFFERVFDILSMIAISLIGLVFITAMIGEIYFWFSIAIGAYVILFLIIIFIASSESRTKRFIGWGCSVFSFIPKIREIGNRLDDFSPNFHNSFRTYKNFRVTLVAIFYSFIIWILEGIVLYIASLALGLNITLLSAVAIISIATLISVITFLPGGIGSSEIIMVLLISSIFAFSLPEITTAVLLARILAFWMYAFFGIIFMNLLKSNNRYL
ncbi:MAG: flippase-like domain-containing protein [Candidatus Aenigmarchaeota archaeon]|nr:flippase-like domain-containing protein [Candidatus Aenigmarchaeota archaeon]